jgi:hypothetical protein
MSQKRRGVISRLFEGLGRVTWGVLRRKVRDRFTKRGGEPRRDTTPQR